MASPRPIPQCNPLATYLDQSKSIDAAVQRVLTGGHYILGPEVAAFEQEFAAFVGVAYGVGVANGTDALAIALRASGIGIGDVVITTSLTAVATTVAIRSVGATPLFVDVDAAHGLLDTGRVADLLDSAARGGTEVAMARIKAILPVHLYGRCVDMNAICALATRYQLAVIEDCAQAHGARFDGRAAGSFGQFGCFSFYPTKNLGAFGDGGAVVTGDAQLRESATLLREYGWRQRYVSDIEGGNSRLDEMQAAILREKLPRLEQANAARNAIAAIYRERIRHPDVVVPAGAPHGGHVYHQFVVRSPRREGLQRHLRDRGVGTLVHYPYAVHQQPAYHDPAYQPMPLVNTECWAAEVLSLPMFPQLAHADACSVADAVNAWNGRN